MIAIISVGGLGFSSNDVPKAYMMGIQPIAKATNSRLKSHCA